MLKKIRSAFVLLFVFSLSATLMGNEWANYYFPDALGSSWTYQDQDGDEFIRHAIEPQDVDGETYRAFSYEPVLEDWADYDYHTHPYFYQISDDWVAFFRRRRYRKCDTDGHRTAVARNRLHDEGTDK